MLGGIDHREGFALCLLEDCSGISLAVPSADSSDVCFVAYLLRLSLTVLSITDA